MDKIYQTNIFIKHFFLVFFLNVFIIALPFFCGYLFFVKTAF